MVEMVTLPRKMIKYHFTRGENPSLLKKTNWFDYHNIIKQKDNLMVEMVGIEPTSKMDLSKSLHV